MDDEPEPEPEPADEDESLPLIRFPALAAEADVAAWVGATSDDLRRILDAAPGAYRQVKVRKRRGEGHRLVHAVRSPLAAMQNAIARSINAAHEFPPHVFGFVKKRSTVLHARQHLGQALVLRADIRDFFDNIKARQVGDAFTLLGARATAVDCLTAICTLDGRLPQGASSSPALSNLAVRHLDSDLLVAAERAGCRYTRYADDLIFSGATVVDVEQVADVLAAHGFELNRDKTRLQRRGRAQYVNGLTVGDPARPHLPRALKQRLRSELRLAQRFGFRDKAARKRLYGQVAYVLGVDRELGERLRRLYDQAGTGKGAATKQSV